VDLKSIQQLKNNINNLKLEIMGTKKGQMRKTSRKAYMQDGGGFTYGAGDGDTTPQKAGMETMAKGGGLKGFMKGGSVLDPVMGKKYGGNKGDLRRSAKRDY